MKKAMGEEQEEEDTQMTAGHLQKLVTADGTYATQSAFSSVKTSKKEQERYVTSHTVTRTHCHFSVFIYMLPYAQLTLLV